MYVIHNLESLPATATGGAVTIGNFDGVHLGHAQIVRTMVARARDLPGPAVVFTFDPHPVRLLRPAECPPPLTWTERKAELLAGLGVEWMVAYPTDTALLNLSAAAFFDQIVRQTLQARAVVEGPNFYFGHNREGNPEVLRRLAAPHGISVDVVSPTQAGGELVSSSRVRRLVGQGDVAGAAVLLTSPYRLRGLVTHGAGRGSRIGFPTANLAGVDTLLPAHGVYAGVGWYRGRRWPAAVNIGPNPTFGVTEAKVEAHLAGCDEHLYGETLEVDFLERLREIRPFASPQELVEQIGADVALSETIARRHLASTTTPTR